MPTPQRLLALTLGPALLLAALPSGPAAAQGSFGIDRDTCDKGALSQILSTSKGNLVGSLGGAAVGGLLGNQVGKGSGNTLATIAGVVGGALAGGYVGRSMDQTDQACVGQTLEHSRVNQTVAWHDPDRDTSYWVTPTRSYAGRRGEPCRDYVTHGVVNGERQEINGTACRQPDGKWETVSAENSGASAPPPSYREPPPSYPPPAYNAPPPSYSSPPPSYSAPPPPPSYYGPQQYR